MERFLFSGWSALLRTAVVGVCAYAILILFLRISGKRTLAKMNAFDLVVTVALGSTLASILLSKDVALAQGVLAFAMLIGLQFLVTWTSIRAHWIRQLVTGEPSLLLYRGKFLSSALKKQRISEDEIHAAVRSAGLASVRDVEAVVLETDGSFSIVQNGSDSAATSLAGVADWPHSSDKR